MSGQDLYSRPTQVGNVPTGMNALLTSPDGVALSLDLDEILSATCKFAVELLKVDHSGLMVFDSGRGCGHVISEYPLIGTKGLAIPLRGVPAEERMVNFEQPIVVHDISLDNSFSPVSGILQEHGIQSLLIVPLISKGRVIGSLGLDMIGEVREFTPDEIKLGQVFANQAAAVIELYEQNKQRAEQLAAFRNTVLALDTQEDLKSILDTITSQAVQFLEAKDGGISQFHPERGELTVIADYKFPQSIGTTIKLEEGLAGQVMRDDLPFKAVDDYNNWPERAPVFAKTERFGAVLIIKLKWQDRIVGVLYINAERGRKFPDELPPLLSLLASTAAMAIANSHLLHEVEIARERIRSSYEASSALAELPDSEQVLQDIANQASEAADAERVRLVLFDESGPGRNFIAKRGDKLVETSNIVRPNGISRRVLSTGQPYRCEDVSKATDEINPAILDGDIGAAMCFPLSVMGRLLGVIWFYYSKPRKFSKDDEDAHALEAYLKQASIAYDSARQMEELEPLWLAAQEMAAADTTEEALKHIVKSARNMLRADYAIIWPYADTDYEPPQELPIREAITDGVDEALRDEVLNEALPVGKITRAAMREGWVGISDIDEPMRVALPEVSMALLQRLGARSFEGLGLTVAGEKLGILYLVYKKRRDFRPDETRRARTFASHAALALKKVKLVDQVAKAQRTARELTELMTLGDMKETLQSFVERTKNEIDCDAVTLFIYNEAIDRIVPLTTMVGVRHQKNATHCQDAPRDSVVYKMLFLSESRHCVSRVDDDELFKDQPFVLREEIKSVCAIPLKVKEHRVGVMFINYRTPHNFTTAELDNIMLRADQAAVAINNGLMYGEQKELVELSKQLLGAADLTSALKAAVSNAAESLRANFVAIVMPDEDGHLKFKCWKGWTEADVKTYEEGKGEDYQTGYTIEHGAPVLVTDYDQEKRFKKRFKVPSIVEAKGIKSGLSVPMLTGGKPVGAMLAHFLKPRTMTEVKKWAGTLSLIANLTAISIQHHRAIESKNRAIKSKIALLEAVQRASDEISRIRLGTDQRELLDRLVEQAVVCLPQAFLGTIQLYDEAKNELRFESVYSHEGYNSLLNLVGEKRLLGSENRPQVGENKPLVRRPGTPIGIAGRTVIEKAPQLVNDVTRDTDYFMFAPETRSELAVPLLTDENKVLGVLNVESKKLAAFSKDDEQALLALAKIIVATIQNVERYRHVNHSDQAKLLEESKILADSSTTLAWLGMASTIWGHSVAGHALDIRDNLKLLRTKLKEYDLEPDVQKLLDDKLSFIDEMANQIRQKPVISLLSLDEAVSDVLINRLIKKRVDQLWSHRPYKDVRYALNLAEQEPRVRCSPAWIKRMLDILIDNAINAMAGSAEPSLTISTRIVENQVQIAITDTGPGIPQDIKYKLFRQRIDKHADSKGLGTGLLMVQAIAQAYLGNARVGVTGPKGTTMCVYLPVIEHR